MYGDQFGEFVCAYWDLKGFNTVRQHKIDLHQLHQHHALRLDWEFQFFLSILCHSLLLSLLKC